MPEKLYGQMGYVLSRACYYNNQEVAELLISKKAPVNGLESDIPILSAITPHSQKNSLNMVKYLVERGADVNQCDPITKETALQRAISYGQKDIVQYLLNKGVVVTDEAIRVAKKAGNEYILELLQS